MTQTMYFFNYLMNQAIGGIPVVNVYSTLEQAQEAWANIEQLGQWGNTINYMQILTVEATVYQATDDAPSGPVTPPDDGGSGDGSGTGE